MGLLGGFANFLSTRTSDEGGWHFWKCVICGIAAAVVVPLFLQTIQCDLMKKLGQEPINYLVFAGFCLIAAFASRPFLDSVAKQALQTANKADAKSNAAVEKAEKNSEANKVLATDLESVKAEVKPVADKFTEEETEPAEASPASAIPENPPVDMVVEQSGTKHVVAGVDTDGLKVLKALASPKFTFRTIEGLQKETGLSRPDLTGHLGWCKQCGFANQIKRENGLRWYITAAGRKLILNPHLPKTLASEPAQQNANLPPP